MKISAKGRYGLASMAFLARYVTSETPTTILTIAERLSISKIYLEQVFSLLKRAGLVRSSKGSQGGYQLARLPREISAYDVLAAIELSLLEKPGLSTGGAKEMEAALTTCVYTPLDEAIMATLRSVSLEDILVEMDRQKSADSLMYFI